MQIIFRIDDSKEMEQAVTGLIELLKTKGGFHGVRTDGGLMIKGKRGWKKVCPVEPWSSPTNNLLWQAMLDKLYMEHYVFRWWAHGGMYSLYYNKPDRYWSLSYEGDQFSMHKVQNNGVIGAHILNIMLTLGGEPHLHIPESPGLAWTDVDGTKAGQRIREQQLAQQSADRQRQQAVAEQQLREQLQAHQNPLLVRLTEELIEAGKSLKEAFAQAKGQLNWAENEARQLAQQAAARQQRAQRKALAALQEVTKQLQAQPNPLLTRLTEDLIQEGKSPKDALNEARQKLNRAEKEAECLDQMVNERLAVLRRQAERLNELFDGAEPKSIAESYAVETIRRGVIRQRKARAQQAFAAEYERQKGLPDLEISLQ